MAVPVLPPPDGEKFAGGYQIQRNPITGGARLLPPPAPGKPLTLDHMYEDNLTEIGVYLKFTRNAFEHKTAHAGFLSKTLRPYGPATCPVCASFC